LTGLAWSGNGKIERVEITIDGGRSWVAAQLQEPRLPIALTRCHNINVPSQQIASIVAEGELLHITTVQKERHTITYRLKDLERRLDPSRFIRLGRGTLANVELITKVSTMPGGTHLAVLGNGQKLQVSRLQSRILRERFLKL